MKNLRLSVKSGLASLYLVAFTTMLLGIVSLSFTQIMLNESQESSNSELSQSAYNSAMAGVEDAKLALLRYKDCIARGFTSSSTPSGDSPDLDMTGCVKAIRLVENDESIIDALGNVINTGSCDIVSNILGRNDENGEVMIQETIGSEESTNTNQAYTCVKITEEAEDYRSVLTADERIRVIPILSKYYEGVVGAKIQWYSNNDRDQQAWDVSNTEQNKFYKKNEATTKLPVVTAELFQTDKSFKMSELDINNANNSGTDHAMITLYPENSVAQFPNVGTFITARNLLDVSNKSSTAAAGTNMSDGTNGATLLPKLISCGYTEGFRCRATLQFPATYNGDTVAYDNSVGPFRSEATFFLRLTLPYGAPDMDFSVTLCKGFDSNGNCDVASFNGVQAIIDSTGRASTMYRRLEARIDLVDSNFPYPEFAVQITGDGTIEKNFWVTKNCWKTVDGQVLSCPNNGNAN